MSGRWRGWSGGKAGSKQRRFPLPDMPRVIVGEVVIPAVVCTYMYIFFLKFLQLDLHPPSPSLPFSFSPTTPSSQLNGELAGCPKSSPEGWAVAVSWEGVAVAIQGATTV